jgi:hypothetical protein
MLRLSRLLLPAALLCPEVPACAQVRHIPAETEAAATGRWQMLRTDILARMQRVMGALPGAERRCPLDVQVLLEERGNGYVRRKITYQSSPGERVPAWLLIPKAAIRRKLPAMLVLHQTTRHGKDEAVGLAGLPNLHIGKELAERGYIVLAPDYPTLGEHETDVYRAGWQSATMKAVWDNIRGIDLLCSMPQTDALRIGAAGHSLGGHNSLFTAAFDTRIRCVVTNCGFTSFAKYYNGNLSGWWGPRYMPKIQHEFPTPHTMPFDFHDVLTAVAPRAVYVSAPLQDSNFEVSGVRDVVESILPVYRRMRAEHRITAVYPECGHDWPKPHRDAMYRWLDTQLHHSPP